MTYYVQRRNGVIVGAYANLQPGLAEEPMDSNLPELAAYLAGPTPVEQSVIARSSAASMVSDGGAERVLLRAALRVIHTAFAEQSVWNARVRARLIALGADPGAPPVVRDWAALMAALEAAIRGGAGDAPAPASAPLAP